MSLLDGRVAIVTGAGRGLGREEAIALAAEGARVAIFGRDKSTLEQARKAIGPDTIAVQGDVAKLADIDRLVRRQDKRLRELG